MKFLLRLLLPYIFCFLCLNSKNMLFAQDSISKRFAKSIEISTLQKHVYLLASDSLEGRGTGQEGCEKASKYIANEFSKYGLIAPMKDEKKQKNFFPAF